MTETENAQQVFTNGEERNGHGDADLDDGCKVTRTACFTNRPTIAATDLGKSGDNGSKLHDCSDDCTIETDPART